jgi:pyruvate,water dikinase
MASAVVTDVGGPLSHSSIVAREYGIPAVLGTGVATRRIADGARVRVDGDAGTVTMLDRADDGSGPVGAPASSRRSTGRGVVVATLSAAAALGFASWRRRRGRKGSS